jgi:hypothetical protein
VSERGACQKHLEDGKETKDEGKGDRLTGRGER